MPTAPPIHRPAGSRKRSSGIRKDDAGARLTRKVHNSSTWRYRVQPAQLRQFPLCCMCEAEGRVVAAVHVDHIRPIRDGGAAYDPANLRSLCKPCHSAVTRAWQNTRGDDDPPPPPEPRYVIA